jgi:hypothetical protein
MDFRKKLEGLSLASLSSYVCKQGRGLPERSSFQAVHSRGVPGLTHKHWSMLEWVARYKHSSLLRKYVNCGRNKFYCKRAEMVKLQNSFFFNFNFLKDDLSRQFCPNCLI